MEKDYHEVIREKLNHFIQLIKQQVGEIHGRGFVDSAPVLGKNMGSTQRTWLGC
jgi:epoxyqueuosine reductase